MTPVRTKEEWAEVKQPSENTFLQTETSARLINGSNIINHQILDADADDLWFKICDKLFHQSVSAYFIFHKKFYIIFSKMQQKRQRRFKEISDDDDS